MNSNYIELINELTSWQFIKDQYIDDNTEFRDLEEEDRISKKINLKSDYVVKRMKIGIPESEMVKEISDLLLEFSLRVRYWSEVFYKQGIKDGINILEIARKFKKLSGEDKIYENFLDDYTDDILITVEDKVYKESEEYKNANRKYNYILMNNPRIEDFFEDGRIENITPEEIHIIFELIQLIREMDDVKFKDGIRLGIKEGNLS